MHIDKLPEGSLILCYILLCSSYLFFSFGLPAYVSLLPGLHGFIIHPFHTDRLTRNRNPDYIYPDLTLNVNALTRINRSL